MKTFCHDDLTATATATATAAAGPGQERAAREILQDADRYPKSTPEGDVASFHKPLPKSELTRGFPMKTRIARAVGAIGLALLGSVAVASPAGAHSSFSCITTWVGPEGADIACFGGVFGDKGRLKLVCQRIGGGTLATKFSTSISASGYASVQCSSGYEVYSKQAQITYADGHTTTM